MKTVDCLVLPTAALMATCSADWMDETMAGSMAVMMVVSMAALMAASMVPY